MKPSRIQFLTCILIINSIVKCVYWTKKMAFSFLFFLVLYYTMREIRVALLGKAHQLKEQRYTDSYKRVQYSVSCVQAVVYMRLPVFGFWMRAQMSLYGFVQGRERLSWKLALGEKSLAASGTLTRVSIAPGSSVGRSTNRAECEGKLTLSLPCLPRRQ